MSLGALSPLISPFAPWVGFGGTERSNEQWQSPSEITSGAAAAIGRPSHDSRASPGRASPQDRHGPPAGGTGRSSRLRRSLEEDGGRAVRLSRALDPDTPREGIDRGSAMSRAVADAESTSISSWPVVGRSRRSSAWSEGDAKAASHQEGGGPGKIVRATSGTHQPLSRSRPA
jgi:hypothetical protein